jgi:hypothetical protein
MARHYTAGAPLEAGKPLVEMGGKAAKALLYPAEGKYPDEDPDKKRKGKKYPKGQALDLVVAQDFREGEVVPEEALLTLPEAQLRREQEDRERMREMQQRTGRRQPGRGPAPTGEPTVR